MKKGDKMKDEIDILLSYELKTNSNACVILGHYHPIYTPRSIEVFISSINFVLNKRGMSYAWDNTYSHVVSHEVIHEVLHRLEDFATCVKFDNIAGKMSDNPEHVGMGMNVKC